MKKIQKLLLLLLMMAMLLPTFAVAETPVIVNLVENPDAEYHFEDGAKILEIVFPRVYSSDCILLRYDGMVMMIDASTKNATMRNASTPPAIPSASTTSTLPTTAIRTMTTSTDFSSSTNTRRFPSS